MTTQNISNIVNVVVEVSPAAAPRSSFNEFLIIGSSTVISTTTRLKRYTALADMLTDGFTSSSHEYEAALLYVNTLYQYSGVGAAFNLWIGVKGSGESDLQAFEACRLAGSEWYVGMVCDAAAADHEAIAAVVGTMLPATIYAGVTSDAAVLAGTTGNVLDLLQAAEYGRVIMQYSANPYAIAGIMGYAMAQNTLMAGGSAGSSYTLKFKQEIGVTVEPLTSAQIGFIETANGNVYLNYGNFYNVFEQGVMSNGQFFDEVVGLDMLASYIQLAIMDLLYQNTKIPQTDPGINFLVHAINAQCDQSVTIGFLAPGQWNGLPVLNMSTGATLPKGYLVQAAPIASQTSSQFASRQAPPIYVAVLPAGAVHSALITVNVGQ